MHKNRVFFLEIMWPRCVIIARQAMLRTTQCLRHRQHLHRMVNAHRAISQPRMVQLKWRHIEMEMIQKWRMPPLSCHHDPVYLVWQRHRHHLYGQNHWVSMSKHFSDANPTNLHRHNAKWIITVTTVNRIPQRKKIQPHVRRHRPLSIL